MYVANGYYILLYRLAQLCRKLSAFVYVYMYNSKIRTKKIA